jgi:hypothetical protein
LLLSAWCDPPENRYMRGNGFINCERSQNVGFVDYVEIKLKRYYPKCPVLSGESSFDVKP